MTKNYQFRESNRECPNCGERLEAQSGPDFQSRYRCPNCEWSKVYDPAADEFPNELEWYER